ncbi:MAG: CapA family protein [Streptosporangiaceae bacterium]
MFFRWCPCRPAEASRPTGGPPSPPPESALRWAGASRATSSAEPGPAAPRHGTPLRGESGGWDWGRRARGAGIAGGSGRRPGGSFTAAPLPGPGRSSAAITIAFAGDGHFIGRTAKLLRHPATAVGPIARVLRSADLIVLNLETAVTRWGTPQPKRYHFRASARAFTALADAGVDVANWSPRWPSLPRDGWQPRLGRGRGTRPCAPAPGSRRGRAADQRRTFRAARG